jgi:hypothetical protein
MFLFGGVAMLTVAMLGNRPRLQWMGYAFVGLATFTNSSFKFDHYGFPAAPALCLLCARAWHDSRHGSSAENAGVRWARDSSVRL